MKQLGKVLLTASQFAWYPDLNETPELSYTFMVLLLCFLLSFSFDSVFAHISNHLKVCQKYSTCHIFNSLLEFGNVDKHGLLLPSMSKQSMKTRSDTLEEWAT